MVFCGIVNFVGTEKLSVKNKPDNFSVPTKFTIPQNTIIQPNSYLIIWADENPSTASYLHSNFKLAAGGEQLMLSGPGGVVLDSISFGAQVTDKSIARCPDGAGTFSVSAFPTFKLSNCAIGVNELKGGINSVSVFPNPANAYLHGQSTLNRQQKLEVFNVLGQVIFSTTFLNQFEISTSNWEPGLYFVHIDNSVVKIIVNH